MAGSFLQGPAVRSASSGILYSELRSTVMATHDELTRVDAVTEDDGCTVDWSWLQGFEIASATSDLQHLKIQFTNGKTLTIQTALYQGRAFLAFDPWKAPTS